MRSHKALSAAYLAGAIMMLAGTSASRPAPAAMPQKMINVPAGTTILVRMLDTVDSSKNPPGSRFAATLETNLVVGSTVVVPKGNTVYGQLIEAKQAGRQASFGRRGTGRGDRRHRWKRGKRRSHRGNSWSSGFRSPEGPIRQGA